MQLFARFLQRLRATPDGDGSLLDHSTILYGSGMGDGNVHAPSPLPMAVVGGRRVPGRAAPRHAGEDAAAEPALGLAHRFDVDAAELRHQHRERSSCDGYRCPRAVVPQLGSRWLVINRHQPVLLPRHPATITADRCRQAARCRRRAVAPAGPRRRERDRGRRHDRASLGGSRRRSARWSTALIKAGARVDRRESTWCHADGAGGHQWQRSGARGLLLKAGANPNDASAEGETVLMTAARTGNCRRPSTCC